VDDRQHDAAHRPVAARSSQAHGRALAAVILAGGEGRRLGGVDKSSLVVGGRSLLAAVVEAAVAAGASQVIVVGPVRADVGQAGGVPVSFTSEEPLGGGPVPALRAGLGLAGERWVLLLAGDLPFMSGRVLGEIVAASPAVLVDDEGRPQWLTSCWRTGELRAALAAYTGKSLRGVLSALAYSPTAVPAEAGVPPCWLDCDTPEDLAIARSFAEEPG
jgi:molybdopterin-guanine dinucleotide biosynthesis protein A